ncbi:MULTISPECIES: hypothetical protein [unclassified Thermoactinomyces]|uniref:hypothetical protein n=1 Tax=unclassified Thermoactinomyces TaxID=2634588 RepID=UPI0018DDA655|nr:MULTISPECIES: hypothetical protein [unclassified Thermoactinomyces]MBH8599089.1 hypothetical protein [Thermoactinomyces sp. CICC 10523]MBH8607980.1 hypothetical protein [Thermoactinomyces sp. CICC 10521]
MKKDWKKVWYQIGMNNPWISEAYDPEFSVDMLAECKDQEDLWENLSHGNWCLGQGFYLGEICFINQINGGDEWLVIKQNLPFESFTVGTMGKEKFLHNLKCIEKATLEQCRRLEYTDVELEEEEAV